MTSLREELQQRWFINQETSEDFFDIYEKGGANFYCWYDPTADSLHLWNFVTIMAAVNFMKKGNTFYLLIGGATGIIWDPGGKEAERNFLTEEILLHNQTSITTQVKSLLQNLKKLSGKDFSFKVINNYDFYKNMPILKFLREVGKYITVNTMIAKDIVKKRIEDPDKSISYTEFSYTLLQGYDFLHLLRTENVQLQIAGSDQRWNITTGTELIRKIDNKEAFGFTVPLILDSTGKKFGKSEGNAIRIDKKKNSPYFVYQYFMNTSDADVARFLKLFTLLELAEIDLITAEHAQSHEKRIGQKKLANYVVTTIFGPESAKQAENISEVLFGDQDKMTIISQMSSEDLKALAHETGVITVQNGKLIDICTQLWLSTSNSEAKKLIQSWSIYLNEKKVDDIQKEITQSDFTNDIILLRKGKKTFKIIQFHK